MAVGKLFEACCRVFVSLTFFAFVFSAAASDVHFRRHVINAESEYLAAAAFDVNRDSRLDIVCGAIWYEAPAWTQHPVRDVEIINGRPDGYSHLALDVNRDDWIDVVTVNWRSGTIKWIQHPGDRLGPWITHNVAQPGPMETGRLYDVDGDGQLDVLPNGANFAAWWSWESRSPDGSHGSPIWHRHALPQQLAGHGIGCGDINGDGRADIIGQFGWAEAPPDRRNQPWTFHADFELDRASVPIVVADVDEDGDRDLVWCRGHDVGVYWCEQVRTKLGEILWSTHVIDSSWAGGHSPLWVDLDGDGRKELVAGKRYLPHEGRDPSEYDPLVGYRYQYDPHTRSWRRWIVTYDEGVGFGLDPKAIDLDADGDLDLICAGRNGLFWLENRSRPPEIGDRVADTVVPPPVYGDHENLMSVKDSAGSQRELRTAFDWGQRRAHILAAVEQVIGKIPSPHHRVPLDFEWGTDTMYEAYRRRPLTFAIRAGERISADLFIPAGFEQKVQHKAPAVLFSLDSPAGDDDFANVAHQKAVALAEHLARIGFFCLIGNNSPSAKSTDGQPSEFNSDASGALQNVWRNIRGIDVLDQLANVDPLRIGAVGEGAGTISIVLTAMFDQRINAVVASGEIPLFAGAERERIDRWVKELQMPRIRTIYENDPTQIPFDLPELLAAVAPRPLFLNVLGDNESIDGRRVRRSIANAREVYALRKSESALRAVFPNTGRESTKATQDEADRWLADVLLQRE